MMQAEKVSEILAASVELLNSRLREECGKVFPASSEVGRAAQYSLNAGGKRIRGALTLSFCDLLGGDRDAACSFGAAIEMLHCYSLIHDDLPCMDNADLRRGRLSCHKKFGEATALLAGDALLTEAFEVLAHSPATAAQKAEAVLVLASAAGGHGMVYGQELDLAFTGKTLTRGDLELLHSHKTGDLIEAAGLLGAAASPRTDRDLDLCRQYTRSVGLAFQVMDDVLDCTASAGALGKPVGGDAEAGKTTYATLLGPSGAAEYALKISQDAADALTAAYGPRADFLSALAVQLARRKK